MEEDQVTLFFLVTEKVFHFLEQDYHYQRIESRFEDPDEGRDATAVCRYIGARVALVIGWGIADASIGVFFIELLQPYVFPKIVTSFPGIRAPKSISFYTLAEMQGFINDPLFLLKDVENPRKKRKRAEIIRNNMAEVIDGLSQAIQKYAINIVEGETSIFPEVMKYYLDQLKRRNPSAFIPGLDRQDDKMGE